jgi:hypothetical protein
MPSATTVLSVASPLNEPPHTPNVEIKGEITLPPLPLPSELDIPSKPRLLSAVEALKEIKRTLPVGIELHRDYHYVFPIGKQKLHLLVLLVNDRRQARFGVDPRSSGSRNPRGAQQPSQYLPWL